MARDLRLGISVEGQTEAYFVKYVLSRYLKKYKINLQNPVILGGNINLQRVENILYLMSKDYDYVTTIYDFYGFDGKDESDTKESLCNKIVADGKALGVNNLIPYIQMYEFEALLFSDLNILCKYMDDDPKEVEKYIELFRENIQDQKPEQINNSIDTAPSKRIHSIFKRYRKSIYGYIVAQEIGINKIREECPKFDQWIDDLIHLSV